MPDKKIDTIRDGISLSSGDSHNTMQGAIPGSISTAGQFQVWAKMSINQHKKEQREISSELLKLRESITQHDLHIQRTLGKDEDQEKKLTALEERIAEGEKKAEKAGLGGMSMPDSIKMAITIGTVLVSLAGVYYKLQTQISLLQQKVNMQVEHHDKQLETLKTQGSKSPK